jgi:hypothetical protein
MTLRVLFGLHAVFTFAAGVMLVIAPASIPGIMGIHLATDAYLLCYLLAAAEFGLAVLSWGAATITDDRALRVIVIGFVVFHATSGLLEIVAFAHGLPRAIWANIALRVIVVVLFVYYGLARR